MKYITDPTQNYITKYLMFCTLILLCNKNLRYSNFIALSNIQILKRIQFEAKFYKIYTPNFSTQKINAIHGSFGCFHLL
ncbi:hypothetical protein A6J42_03505 [Leptospira interrogans serovar Copenhageni]|uniref:Uncharacterized protein n=1 Tax=Leptospira interrogans serovar Bataviae TaxID=312175 RepID=A0AAQ0B2L3_LEPIR|nr:hypothetical protein A6J42_03505 [Leptospira interrogans serovar Copenhageni]MBE0305333.1 hypothetical protein [Leptospira interrogans serovar Yeoncheon]QOI34681.1 hypothetical protein LeptoLang_10945 [Leptospira interrogans serovar Icterohaemorrhagiae]QOI38328.1 hypothetical protein Lepto1548_08585 [Leptospira interrogans serovar Bataviae]KAA5552731.1 hypothetical protein F3G11_00160 [Leptospira interrogans serovar Copenhageni]